MFIDQVKVVFKAGRGGDGCLSFRRERGVPHGGPDGGRGGDGGSIYFISSESVNSLAYFRYHPISKAKKGAHGEGSNRYGKKGEDLMLRVPVGTVVREEKKEDILFDFLSPGEKYLAVKGGKGGRGNASFATPTFRTPRIREKGKPGEEKELILELKLIADVGLVGFPNVGKSTLISKISAAKPVIADYPFTTLVPNLGVVDMGEHRSFVVADIPGLIEGAHLGHGLGIRFLKHVERTKVLVHLIDVSPYTERDPVSDFYVVMKELQAFDPKMSTRKHILAANKIDLLSDNRERLKSVESLAREMGLAVYAISAMKGTGLKPLVAAMAECLDVREGLPEKEKNA